MLLNKLRAWLSSIVYWLLPIVYMVLDISDKIVMFAISLATWLGIRMSKYEPRELQGSFDSQTGVLRIRHVKFFSSSIRVFDEFGSSIQESIAESVVKVRGP